MKELNVEAFEKITDISKEVVQMVMDNDLMKKEGVFRIMTAAVSLINITLLERLDNDDAFTSDPKFNTAIPMVTEMIANKFKVDIPKITANGLYEFVSTTLVEELNKEHNQKNFVVIAHYMAAAIAAEKCYQLSVLSKHDSRTPEVFEELIDMLADLNGVTLDLVNHHNDFLKQKGK